MAKGKSEFAALIAAFDALGESIKESLSAPVVAATKTVDQFGGQIEKGLNGAFANLVKSSLTPLTAATNLYAIACSNATQQILAFVTKANPAAAFRFNRALDDLAGTMGQILLPVLDSITKFIREFADTLQGMKPVFAPIMKGFADIIKVMSTTIVPVLSAMASRIGILGDVMGSILVPLAEVAASLISSGMALLVPQFENFAIALRLLVIPQIELLVKGLKVLADAIKFVVDLIPDITPKLKKGESTGAAVRPASYGKIEDIGKRTTLNALNMGQGLTPDGKAVTSKLDRVITLLEKNGKELLNKTAKWASGPLPLFSDLF